MYVILNTSYTHIMNIRLIYSDVDGTLITPKGELTESTKKAVYKVNELNIPFVLVSARSPEEMFDYYKELDLNSPIISYNGGMISEYKNNELNILSSTPICSDEPKMIYDMIKENFSQISISIYVGTKWYADEIDFGIEIEKKLTGKSPIIKNISEFLSGGTQVHKIMMIGASNDIVNADKFLKSQSVLTSSIHRSGEIYLEVTNKEATKINALKKISTEYFNISEEHIMAIGDGYNDWDMLKYAKYGVAMENASFEIKESLKYITKSNLEEGVAYILNKLVLQ